MCSHNNVGSNRISSKNDAHLIFSFPCDAHRGVREPGTLSSGSSRVQTGILPGSLVMADQVRYMVKRVTREDWSRPDLG